MASISARCARFSTATIARAQIWMTEVGYSTWRGDEAEQVERFRQALAAPADRLYWYGWQDIPRTVAVQEGLYFDPRHYHMGITDADGTAEAAAPSAGIQRHDGAAARPDAEARAIARPAEPIVVMGGAGFIGTNLADQLLRRWRGGRGLRQPQPARRRAQPRLPAGSTTARRLHTVLADIRDTTAVDDAVRNAKAVFHFAAQVAVTSSLVDPMQDFAVNAQGTLTILDALRRLSPETPLIFASTNKVYGALTDLAVEQFEGRYLPVDPRLRELRHRREPPARFLHALWLLQGSGRPVCAGLRAVLRPADRGAAHELHLRPAPVRHRGPGLGRAFPDPRAAGEPITIYGDGRQVRDILHVNDAVAAYRAVLGAIDRVSGRAFNLGGGPANAVSLRAVLDEIAALTGRRVACSYAGLAHAAISSTSSPTRAA